MICRQPAFTINFEDESLIYDLTLMAETFTNQMPSNWNNTVVPLTRDGQVQLGMEIVMC